MSVKKSCYVKTTRIVKKTKKKCQFVLKTHILYRKPSKKKSFVTLMHLLPVNTDMIIKHKASFQVKQEITRTILGTNKGGQRRGLIGP